MIDQRNFRARRCQHHKVRREIQRALRSSVFPCLVIRGLPAKGPRGAKCRCHDDEWLHNHNLIEVPDAPCYSHTTDYSNEYRLYLPVRIVCVCGHPVVNRQHFTFDKNFLVIFVISLFSVRTTVVPLWHSVARAGSIYWHRSSIGVVIQCSRAPLRLLQR